MFRYVIYYQRSRKTSSFTINIRIILRYVTEINSTGKKGGK